MDLRRISEETPEALLGYPDPSRDRPDTEPFSIHFASWASDIAATLHEKYGAAVDLEVGAIRFPSREFLPGSLLTLPETPAGSLGLGVEPLGLLSVRSGRSAMPRVRVLNHSEERQLLGSNGQLQAAVVDATGAVVGRYVGAQHLPFVGFPVDPGRSREVPVLIGTDSVDPRLGYAVPPGQWHLVVLLDVHRGRVSHQAVSGTLPLTVTP